MYLGDLTLIVPVLYLTAAAIVVLVLGVIEERRKGWLEHFLPAHYLAPALVVPGLILSGWVVVQSMMLSGSTVTTLVGTESVTVPAVNLFVTTGGHAQLAVDPFAAILSFIAFAGTAIVMLLSIDHFGENQANKGEYYALLMFAAVAASLAAASSDLIAIYLSIEFLSLTSYVLAAYAKGDRRSSEAGLKYFLYGAACSAIMIYGMSILFGVTGGSTSLSAIAAAFTVAGGAGAAVTGAGWVGIVFTLAGFGFKLALVPFHFWAPDTYEGAPTPITAFLSVVSKAAGLAVIIRFLTIVALPDSAVSLSWYWILAVLSFVSMFYGNLVAIPQRSIKRMLAYSSIAQVGYMMVGVLAAMHVFTRPGMAVGIPSASVRAFIPDAASGSLPWGMQGVLIYIFAYLLMNLGAFAVAVAVGKRLGSDSIEDYSGLMARSPFYAVALTVFFVSLAGIPPTAGFLGKFFVFGSAIRIGSAGHPELIVLAVAGVINSIISVYYYFNVVRHMFFVRGKSEEPVRGGFAVNAAVLITVVLTLLLVVFAKPASDVASKAVYTSPAVHAPLPR